LENKKWMKRIPAMVTILLVTAVLVCSHRGLLWPLEQAVADMLYSRKYQINNSIKIITIDQKSEAEYGFFSEWTRARAAQLVETLTQQDGKPAVIGFDVNFIAERDEEGDAAFVRAAEAHGNVVTAARAEVFEAVEERDGEYVKDTVHVNNIEYPYEALRKVSYHGFTNAIMDEDNYVRRGMLSLKYAEETEYHFAYEVYKRYSEAMGRDLNPPEIDEKGNFGIRYIAPPGSYDSYAWSDVVNGEHDPRIFEDAIVLVGAYMPGMQDEFLVPVSRGEHMYGVEIHANIVDGLLRGYSYQTVPKIWVTCANFLLCLIYFLLLRKTGPLFGAIAGGVLATGYLAAATWLYSKGWYLYPVAFVLCMICMLAVHVLGRYVWEWLSKRKLLKEFKKYVAPQVLAEMSRSGEFSVKLGGECRDIAVLFVDIRGFTKLSEELAPEQVVEMLNEYLALTTEAVFANGGTLDKFIGDATMAVFNAPVDLPDYKARAVKAALDIVHGAERINERIKKKIDREVMFGVGVHCGTAIVGNIGCETRMDYTAIGDTVNTASRLEGKALGGQVVISETLYRDLADRLIVEPLGVAELKGKAEPIQIYSVLEFADITVGEAESHR